MNRAEKRAARSSLRSSAKEWPTELTSVPESEWPWRPAEQRPRAVWRSSGFLVQAYGEPPHGEVEVLRLSVVRASLEAKGGWEAGITWDELMGLKREAGFGDWYGVEVYPRERDIVNIASMRHLWLFAEPLAIGWFNDDFSEVQS